MIARMPIGSEPMEWTGPLKPSSEWRIHHDLASARPDFQAIVHTHAQFCTIMANARKPIPAIHYMIAAFGGSDIPLADYATFGTKELSDNVVSAMAARNGCLMANHGMIVGAGDLIRAAWLVEEMEALAHQYVHALQMNEMHILKETEIEEAARKFDDYGPKESGKNRA